jgi:serine/threonine protein kinase
MGEVYRARDTKLNRDVALKVLPDAFTLDADRLARFKREAQVLASLNHPNIGAIYGFEESGATHALVLDLVEGPTLADRIAQGPLPLDDALPIAKQIATALETAHEQGIIHRDLKPANIKVRSDGAVKVLDFGLAKLGAGEAGRTGGASVSLTNSPTITSPSLLTSVGLTLGTAAYMSPEQAKGLQADKRSDVWAFGCVLFEMLTAIAPLKGPMSPTRSLPSCAPTPTGRPCPPMCRRPSSPCSDDVSRRTGGGAPPILQRRSSFSPNTIALPIPRQCRAQTAHRRVRHVGRVLQWLPSRSPRWPASQRGPSSATARRRRRRPFQRSGARERISTAGGAQVRWRSDGKELFYLALDGQLMSVPIQLDPDNQALRPGVPVPLFTPPLAFGVVPPVQRQQYVPSPDGTRFLVNTSTREGSTSAITIISNWKPKP